MRRMKTGTTVVLACVLAIILTEGATAGKLQQELVQQSTIEQTRIRHILITDGGVQVGFLSVKDLIAKPAF